MALRDILVYINNWLARSTDTFILLKISTRNYFSAGTTHEYNEEGMSQNHQGILHAGRS